MRRTTAAPVDVDTRMTDVPNVVALPPVLYTKPSGYEALQRDGSGEECVGLRGRGRVCHSSSSSRALPHRRRADSLCVTNMDVHGLAVKDVAPSVVTAPLEVAMTLS